MIKPQINLWHDDIREAPDGWRWAKTNAQAQELLINNNVQICSLDHDLGATPTGSPDDIYLIGNSAQGNGTDLVQWMIDNHLLPPIIYIHSMNIVGAMHMEALLKKAGANVKRVIYSDRYISALASLE